tara:strand:+ start:272 stop:511 length:240 start_codon:yes stop_codon:yes gene_type:complete
MTKQGYFSEEWKPRKSKRSAWRERKIEYLQRRLNLGLARKRICSCCHGLGYTIEELPHKEQKAILRAKRGRSAWKEEEE